MTLLDHTALDRLDAPQPPFDATQAWQRLVALGSYLRTLDPTLGDHLRCTRRQPAHASAGAPAWRLWLSSDQRAHLPYGVMEDEGARPLWDEVARLMGQDEMVAERQRLAIALQTSDDHLDKGLARAGYTSGAWAIKRAKIEHVFDQTHANTSSKSVWAAEDDEHMDVLFSTPAPLPTLACMAHPDLARKVWLQPPADTITARPAGILEGARRQLRQLRQLLSTPFAQTSTDERQQVRAGIERLNRRSDGTDGSFERAHQHGWAAYAITQGASTWLPFLFANKLAAPGQACGQITPMMAAIASDDHTALRILLAEGVSPSAYLTPWPVGTKAFNGQRVVDTWSEASEETLIPPLVAALSLGAKKCAHALLDAQANPSAGTDALRYPLTLAVQMDDARMVERLARAGARLDAVDRHGLTAAQWASDTPGGNAVRNWLEAYQHNPQMAGALANTLSGIASRRAKLQLVSSTPGPVEPERPRRPRRP